MAERASQPGPEDDHLQRLRGWRDRRARIDDLGFMQDQFKRDVAKPFKQLQDIAPHWQRHVPAALQERCKLESLARGVLTVQVEDSGTLYELDRELRAGLEQTLRKAYAAGKLRRIKLVQAPLG